MTGTTTRTTTTRFGWCAAESAIPDPFRLERVYRAYRTCRRRKRASPQVQRYDMTLLDRLVTTADDLAARVWQPARSVCFAVSRPKAREIHAAAFADRVVHHVLVPQLEPYFEPVFIHDLYSNRVGKGIHAAVRRLGHFMRQATGNGAHGAWYLQLDVRNFFNTIDHGILKDLLTTRIARACQDPRRCADLLWLAGQIVDGAQQVVAGGDPRALERVPPHKRLAAAGPGRGLPIGNLTSQFFANVYLNPLDQFVKHRLKVHGYLRYVDDCVLVHEDPVQLEAWGEDIDGFLGERLGLALKSPWRLRPVDDGADFLGYIVRPWYRLVRRRAIGHLEERLGRLEADLSVRPPRGRRAAGSLPPGAPGAGRPALLLDLAPEPREALRATLASYCGHLGHAHARRLAQALFTRRPWLAELFTLRPGPRLRPRWEPRGMASLRGQWRTLRRRFRPGVLAIQVGRCWELYGGDHRTLPAAMLARGKSSTRPGLGAGWSFPLRLGPALEWHWRAGGQGYAVVAEEGFLPGGLKRRVLRRLYRPDGEGAPYRADGRGGRRLACAQGAGACSTNKSVRQTGIGQ